MRHNLRMEREMIEITMGPTINHPGDSFRRFTPGPWRYFVVVDGVETPIDRDTFERLRAENDETPPTPLAAMA